MYNSYLYQGLWVVIDPNGVRIALAADADNADLIVNALNRDEDEEMTCEVEFATDEISDQVSEFEKALRACIDGLETSLNAELVKVRDKIAELEGLVS